MDHRLKNLLSHLIFWVVIILAYALSEFGYTNNFKLALLYELAYLPSRLLAVYLNWFILIPRLVYKNKLLLYVLILGLSLFVIGTLQRYFLIIYVNPVLFPEWQDGTSTNRILFRIFQSIVVIASPVAFSTGIKIFMDWYRQRSREKKLEKENIETELKYLRSQINPHFLFNTLNNLYGLSIEGSKKVPGLILKLSDFLSYSLYETQGNNRSSLQKELDLVEDYIELEISRFDHRVNVTRHVDCPAADKITVPPFLMIPLVENAFKHGVREEVKTSAIELKLMCHEGHLNFSISNTIAGEYIKEDQGGIGLNNLKRRLDLLMPGKYDLVTKVENNIFYAELKLDINESI